jgi:putative chitinase
MCITASVGKGGVNSYEDVKTVQILMNMNMDRLVPFADLELDGGAGRTTIAAIQEFQRRELAMPNPDGRIDPGGQSFKKLCEAIPRGATEEVLQAIFIRATAANIKRYAIPLRVKMGESGITTPLRQCHFFAQIAAETVDLTYCEEIASGAEYEGRTDLGNTVAGDGKRFKGRGLIQLTGRSNYKAYGDAKGVDFTSEAAAATIASTPELAVDVSCWYWSKNSINDLADQDDVMAVTQKVNGGYNGLAYRKARLARAKFFLMR